MPVDISQILGALNMLHQSNVSSSQMAERNQQRRAQGIGQVTGLLGAAAGGALGGMPGAMFGMGVGQSLGTASAGGPPVSATDLAQIGMQAYGMSQQQQQKQAQGALLAPQVEDAKAQTSQQLLELRNAKQGGYAENQSAKEFGLESPSDATENKARTAQIQGSLDAQDAKLSSRLGMLNNLSDPKVLSNLNPAMAGMLLQPQHWEQTPGAISHTQSPLLGEQTTSGGKLKIYNEQEMQDLGYGRGVTGAAYADEKGTPLTPPHVTRDVMQNMSQDAKDDYNAAWENAKNPADRNALYMHYRATRNAVPRPGGFDEAGNPRTVSSIRYSDATENFYKGAGPQASDASVAPAPRSGSALPTVQPRVGATQPAMAPEQLQLVNRHLNALEGIDKMKNLVGATGPIANMSSVKLGRDLIHMPDEKLRAFNSEVTSQSPMLKEWVSRVAALDWNIDAMVGMFPDGSMRPEVNMYRLGRLEEMGKNSLTAELENMKYKNVQIPEALAARAREKGINISGVKRIDHTADQGKIGGSQTNPMVLSDEEFGVFKGNPAAYSKAHPGSWIRYNGVTKQLGK